MTTSTSPPRTARRGVGVARPARVLLRDGTPAVLVALGPEDVPELLDLHERLPDRDRYLRFATLHPSDLEGYVRRTVDPATGAVSLGARVRGRLVGVVQLLPLGGEVAEAAAVVDPAVRHTGVATVLLEQLAVTAGRMGISRLLAMVLAGNGPMIRVLHDLGLPLDVRREGTTLRIEVALHPGGRYRDVAEERHRTAAAAGLRAVLRPRSVAVVGAGRRETSVGRAVLRSLRAAGFPGEVSAVNPHAGVIEDVPCHPSVRDLPSTVDLAVVCVPASAVPDVVEQCGERGVRALLVVSGGLDRVPGAADRVRDLTGSSGMRMVGPNSLGVSAPGPPAFLDATFTGLRIPAGDIGVVTQSGGIALAAIPALGGLGLGLSAMVSVGEAADVGARDLLAWFDEFPGTRVAVVYAESEPDLRGLVGTAAHLGARVPIVALESGTTRAGARAAASHTARAATPRAVREAAYASAGIQSVPDLTALTAAVGLLRGQPLPGPGTVAVLTNVGGGGVLAADACVSAGLAVDPLPEPLQARLRTVLPLLASTGNPVDAGAAVSPGAFAAALSCLLEDSAVSAVVTVTAPTAVSDPAPGVADAAATHGESTPVVDVRLGRATAVERVELPDPGRFLVSVADPATAAHALAVVARRAAWLARPAAVAAAPPGVDVRAARAVVTGVLDRAPQGDWLLPAEVAGLCAAAALPMVPTHWAPTAAEAGAAAARLRGPVAVKGVVRGVPHKADAGLLRLPVTGAREVAGVVAEWVQRSGQDWLGAVVQPVVEPGDELLVGAVHDPAAGAVVALGPGGRAADALGHRVHRLAPLTDADAAEMLAATGLFDTPHGRSLDRAGIADCLRRVAWLADALPEVAEVDVNPLVVGTRRCTALDVRVRVGAAGG
ncbi:Acyl-CoA synthetase (NDP forming) [Geodermatophilus obscurus]|uniref:Acyl-CoA synthetase (NDP forming) n=1 Tax=Geodermatophilus obscurus TaxID=1861 RepID=A0A1M7UZA7_9ACTN|nr:GNAT family N-acetyltransferase [Geodermatophilus obscurus]SHN88371.1 Acyl-CoA synthetase (NDP forming) [Geodermatophilus obscurus]